MAPQIRPSNRPCPQPLYTRRNRRISDGSLNDLQPRLNSEIDHPTLLSLGSGVLTIASYNSRYVADAHSVFVRSVVLKTAYSDLCSTGENKRPFMNFYISAFQKHSQ
jgi:hypothetical protein